MSHAQHFDEPKLILGLKQGDTLSFDTLFLRYSQAVFFNVLKLVKQPEIAEDITQEVFVRLWEKRDGFDESRSVSGWLFIVSFNLSVSALRKKSKEIRLYQTLLDNPEEAEFDSDEYDKQVIILEKAINRLSPQKKRALELCKFEGNTYEAAAVQLNISKHTIKEYISEALKDIRKFANENSISCTILVSFIHFCN